ncbi:MAG TPA: phasin family protein [Candidatus Methylomirabilis sp.]|nr:phasin family protein [Candidatus Methylomirabilis sp.]
MERRGEELLNFAKQAFHATLDAAGKVQQQTQKLMEELMRHGAGAQEEGKRVLTDWVEQSKKHADEFQRAAAEGYRKWEAELSKRLATINPATKQEVEVLRKRVDQLEKKVKASGRLRVPKRATARKRR